MNIKIDRRELLVLAGYLGAGLLGAGCLRYLIQDLLGTFNAALIISGAVLLIVSIAANFGAIRTASGRRSTKLGANTTALAVAVVAILVIANFLSYRHHKRIDLTTEKLYSLSDQSRKIASTLQTDVKVIRFDKEHDDRFRDLMREYRDLTSHITYEEVDPQEKMALANQYKVQEFGDVIVAAGDRTERVRDSSEPAITNAILKVTRDRLKTICFVEGHGEKKLSASDGSGYSRIEENLKNENYQTKTMNLVTENQVPADCDVLVLLGPKQALLPQEAAIIGKYLDSGGKAAMLLDPETEPEVNDVLKAWNIDLGNDVVLDVSGLGRMVGAGPEIPLGRPKGSHEITKDLETTATFFPLARSVSSGSGSAGGASVTEILQTTDQSWAETDIEGLKKGTEVKRDEGKDKKGPISIGVAATKNVGGKESRLVVIGDSDFASNNTVRVGGNRDLFMNAINWLAQDEDLISIRSKNPTERTLTMTESERSWLYILLMPGLVVGSGVWVWWKRR